MIARGIPTKAGGSAAALLLCASGLALLAAADTSTQQLRTGKEIYRAGCVGCHGGDGKGAPQTTLGFEPPDTFPDFTRCDQTTPELNSDWKAVIRDGGPARGFSPIMPSFAETLTSEQMDLVIGYLRSFCRDPSWPRGELNLPRAIATEKAFLENEVVITTGVNARGESAVATTITYERRVGARNQIEVSAPVTFRQQDNTWYGGIGDIGLGWKRNLFSSFRSGSILSVQGEVAFPNGNKSRGLGSGVTTFETFASYGQLLPGKAFVQLQAGAELPVDTSVAPRAGFWRVAAGKSINQGRGLGCMWSPMVEVLADRDFATGAKTNWDVLPQMQVTLSRRQHIRASAGVRIPATNTSGRSVQAVFYLLWDWFDGKLTEGW